MLVDKADKARAALTVASDDQPTLILADNAGNPRLTLALSKYGEPMLSFADAGGVRRLVLSLDLYGTMLRLTDDAGKARAALVVPSTGEPALELLSKDDKILWHAPSRHVLNSWHVKGSLINLDKLIGLSRRAVMAKR